MISIIGGRRRSYGLRRPRRYRSSFKSGGGKYGCNGAHPGATGGVGGRQGMVRDHGGGGEEGMVEDGMKYCEARVRSGGG